MICVRFFLQHVYPRLGTREEIEIHIDNLYKGVLVADEYLSKKFYLTREQCERIPFFRDVLSYDNSSYEYTILYPVDYAANTSYSRDGKVHMNERYWSLIMTYLETCPLDEENGTPFNDAEIVWINSMKENPAEVIPFNYILRYMDNKRMCVLSARAILDMLIPTDGRPIPKKVNEIRKVFGLNTLSVEEETETSRIINARINTNMNTIENDL